MAIFDGKLKQRLIGAVVLIILAVVFLPIIFNNKGATLRDGTKPQDVTVTTPALPAQQNFPSTTLEPVETPQLPTEVSQVDTQIVVAAPQGQTQSAPAINRVPPTTATTPAASQPSATGLTPSWTIQLVALSSKENAEKFRDKLITSHYNAYVRSEGKIHRVFVGPLIDKNEASRLQKQLQKQFNEKGIVREFKPERQ